MTGRIDAPISSVTRLRSDHVFDAFGSRRDKLTNQENPSAQSPDDSSTDTVTLIDNRTGRQTTLPILDGTAGPSVIDVRNLYAKAEYFTFDPGSRGELGRFACDWRQDGSARSPHCRRRGA